MRIRDNMTILFQGDSVTDCGRDRASFDLGVGYPSLVAAKLQDLFPNFSLRFINRGVSGDRVVDLERRLTADCIELQPDMVSILIGINDTWRRFDNNDETGVADFANAYGRVLMRIRRELPTASIVLLDPFVLPVLPGQDAWRVDLDPKIQAVRTLAREFSTLYVPLDGLFAAACCEQEPFFFADDGVHPTAAGHMLIADAWVRAVVQDKQF